MGSTTRLKRDRICYGTRKRPAFACVSTGTARNHSFWFIDDGNRDPPPSGQQLAAQRRPERRIIGSPSRRGKAESRLLGRGAIIVPLIRGHWSDTMLALSDNQLAAIIAAASSLPVPYMAIATAIPKRMAIGSRRSTHNPRTCKFPAITSEKGWLNVVKPETFQHSFAAALSVALARSFRPLAR
jgi:hypothetical protein